MNDTPRACPACGATWGHEWNCPLNQASDCSVPPPPYDVAQEPERPAWSTPTIVEVPPGSAEFEAILASLSVEDRAIVRGLFVAEGEVEMTVESDATVKYRLADGSWLGSLAIISSILGSREDFWRLIIKLAFKEDGGNPPNWVSNVSLIDVVCFEARKNGFEADLKKDGSSILRAAERKK